MTLSHGFDDVTHKVKKKLSSSYKDLYVSLHKDESLYTSAVPLHFTRFPSRALTKNTCLFRRISISCNGEIPFCFYSFPFEQTARRGVLPKPLTVSHHPTVFCNPFLRYCSASQRFHIKLYVDNIIAYPARFGNRFVEDF